MLCGNECGVASSSTFFSGNCEREPCGGAIINSESRFYVVAVATSISTHPLVMQQQRRVLHARLDVVGSLSVH